MSAMSMKSLPLALVSMAMLTAPACMAAAITEQVHCARDLADARPCTMRDSVGADGMHHMSFVSGDTRTVFVGKAQSGWWSGKLDGKPAMGYELNRGHVVFSNMDLGTRFEWWSEGKQHGTY